MTTYKIGHTIGKALVKNPVIVIATVSILAFIFAVANGVGDFKESKPDIPPVTAAVTEIKKPDCVKDETAIISEASNYIKDRPEKTINMLADCILSTGNPKFIKLSADAKKQADNNHAMLEKEIGERKRLAKIEAKKNGVSIGMTQQEVLDSSWGKPKKINTTTNKYYTREQWVYGNGGSGYLYFKDGILETIQN